MLINELEIKTEDNNDLYLGKNDLNKIIEEFNDLC